MRRRELPTGPHVYLSATARHGVEFANEDLKADDEVYILGVIGNQTDGYESLQAVILAADGEELGNFNEQLDHFTDIRVLYPGSPDADRVTVLNDMLEQRTPWATGQSVTVDLAKDILALLDTMHIPKPTTPEGDRAHRVVRVLYKDRGLLEEVCGQFAPFILGPWKPVKDGEVLKKWSRDIDRGYWLEFEAQVTRLVVTTADGSRKTGEVVDWWIRYKAGRDDAEHYQSGREDTDVAAMSACDAYLRSKGFILLS